MITTKPTQMPAFHLVLALLLGFTASAIGTPVNILFVGNSFTFGAMSPAEPYNHHAISDANGTNQGGVPGIFKKMTEQSGLVYNVTIEAVGGETLAYHFAHKAAIIGGTNWDEIVLQGYSTESVPAKRGGNPDAFNTAIRQIKDLVKSRNSAARFYLYETWARPDLVFPWGSPYSGSSLSTMQSDIHEAYAAAALKHGISDIAPVGDAFLLAIKQGIANPTPCSGPMPGKIDLWNIEHYHGSTLGYYLAAAVLYAKITGLDPRQLAVGPDSAAGGLGIDAAQAQELDRIASESVR